MEHVGKVADRLARLPNQREMDWSVNTPPTSADLAFLARELVQCTLPHRDPGNVPLWTRTNGDLSITIARTEPDENGQPIGYPYGTIPRLVMYWLNTEACRTKSRHIELGQNLASFMVDIGLNPDMGTGKRSDARRLHNQMERLFSASIKFRRWKEQDGAIGRRSKEFLVAADSELWWDHVRKPQPRQSVMWRSWVELGETFFKAIIESPVPLDKRVLSNIRQSPLALDVYGVMEHRCYSAYVAGKSSMITWQLLSKQMGSDYADVREFRRSFLAALLKIGDVAHLRYELVNGMNGGLKIKPAPKSIMEGRLLTP